MEWFKSVKYINEREGYVVPCCIHCNHLLFCLPCQSAPQHGRRLSFHGRLYFLVTIVFLTKRHSFLNSSSISIFCSIQFSWARCMCSDVLKQMIIPIYFKKIYNLLGFVHIMFTKSRFLILKMLPQDF